MLSRGDALVHDTAHLGLHAQTVTITARWWMANASAKCQGLSRARKVLPGTSARSRPSLQAPPSPVLLQTLLRAWAPLSRARRSVSTPSENSATVPKQQYQPLLSMC